MNRYQNFINSEWNETELNGTERIKIKIDSIRNGKNRNGMGMYQNQKYFDDTEQNKTEHAQYFVQTERNEF